MKKILLVLLLVASSLIAEVIHEYPSHKIFASKIPVVDIRTPDEWKETGLLKGSIPITFFNERGDYDVEAFLNELNQKVDTTKPFALICRVGSRTKILSPFLSAKFGYKVTNLIGGMVFAKAKSLPITPYK